MPLHTTCAIPPLFYSPTGSTPTKVSSGEVLLNVVAIPLLFFSSTRLTSTIVLQVKNYSMALQIPPVQSFSFTALLV